MPIDKNHSCPMCSCVFDEQGKVITAGRKAAPARDSSLRTMLAELKAENKELLAELRATKGGKGGGKPKQEAEEEEKSIWD